MAAFFTELLDGFLKPDFLESVRRKFHYGETQAEEFQEVAEEMLPLLRQEAFWERKEISALVRLIPEKREVSLENVVISLGGGIDALQEKYTADGLLSQSYMAEVLASELLLRSYPAYNCYVSEHTKFHAARYHFPGSEEAYPLAMLPQLLESTTRKVTCNAAFCMLPKKSVAFIAELTTEQNVRCEGVCVGCGNKDCANRIENNNDVRNRIIKMTDMPLPYGYSRIFGVR